MGAGANRVAKLSGEMTYHCRYNLENRLAKILAGPCDQFFFETSPTKHINKLAPCCFIELIITCQIIFKP